MSKLTGIGTSAPDLPSAPNLSQSAENFVAGEDPYVFVGGLRISARAGVELPFSIVNLLSYPASSSGASDALQDPAAHARVLLSLTSPLGNGVSVRVGMGVKGDARGSLPGPAAEFGSLLLDSQQLTDELRDVYRQEALAFSDIKPFWVSDYYFLAKHLLADTEGTDYAYDPTPPPPTSARGERTDEQRDWFDTNVKEFEKRRKELQEKDPARYEKLSEEAYVEYLDYFAEKKDLSGKYRDFSKVIGQYVREIDKLAERTKAIIGTNGALASKLYSNLHTSLSFGLAQSFDFGRHKVQLSVGLELAAPLAAPGELQDAINALHLADLTASSMMSVQAVANDLDSFRALLVNYQNSRNQVMGIIQKTDEFAGKLDKMQADETIDAHAVVDQMLANTGELQKRLLALKDGIQKAQDQFQSILASSDLRVKRPDSVGIGISDVGLSVRSDWSHDFQTSFSVSVTNLAWFLPGTVREYASNGDKMVAKNTYTANLGEDFFPRSATAQFLLSTRPHSNWRTDLTLGISTSLGALNAFDTSNVHLGVMQRLFGRADIRLSGSKANIGSDGPDRYLLMESIELGLGPVQNGSTPFGIIVQTGTDIAESSDGPTTVGVNAGLDLRFTPPQKKNRR